MPLTARDRAILEFESSWGRHRPDKEEAIRLALGLSAARYYQLLGRLLDHPEALEYDPMLIGRLRRLRDAREAQRRGRISMTPTFDR